MGPDGSGCSGYNDRNWLIIRLHPVAVKKELKRDCLRVDHRGTRTAIPARETYLHDEMDDWTTHYLWLRDTAGSSGRAWAVCFLSAHRDLA